MLENIFGLKGKVCVITGGNGGIGFGMAEGLAKAGANVIIWGSNPAKNARAEEILKNYNPQNCAMQVDVGNEDQIIAAMAQVFEKFGRIDNVVANAGISKPSSFLDTKLEDWRKVMQINLDGVFLTLREGAKYMVERAKKGELGGSLVATSSMSAYFGAPANEAYSSSKAAVVLLIKGLAVELARYGIRSNAILPGWVATDMTNRLQDNDKFNQQVIGRVPQRRWADPAEFAGIAIYLASNASSFHNGDAILIDGGYSCY